MLFSPPLGSQLSEARSSRLAVARTALFIPEPGFARGMESVLHNDLRGFEVVQSYSVGDDWDLDGIDFVLIDQAWPDWCDLVTRIKQQNQDIRCVVLTTIAGDFAAVRANSCGADGVYYRLAPLADLCRTMVTLIHGGQAIDRSVSNLDSLSPSMMEVFEMLGKGMSTSQIAASRGRSVKTIQTFILRMRQKLDLDSLEALYESAKEWIGEEEE
jgi:DNA-binding NarL/FixJ family response regulator